MDNIPMSQPGENGRHKVTTKELGAKMRSKREVSLLYI